MRWKECLLCGKTDVLCLALRCPRCASNRLAQQSNERNVGFNGSSRCADSDTPPPFAQTRALLDQIGAVRNRQLAMFPSFTAQTHCELSLPSRVQLNENATASVPSLRANIVSILNRWSDSGGDPTNLLSANASHGVGATTAEQIADVESVALDGDASREHVLIPTSQSQSDSRDRRSSVGINPIPPAHGDHVVTPSTLIEQPVLFRPFTAPALSETNSDSLSGTHLERIKTPSASNSPMQHGCTQGIPDLLECTRPDRPVPRCNNDKACHGRTPRIRPSAVMKPLFGRHLSGPVPCSRASLMPESAYATQRHMRPLMSHSLRRSHGDLHALACRVPLGEISRHVACTAVSVSPPPTQMHTSSNNDTIKSADSSQYSVSKHAPSFYAPRTQQPFSSPPSQSISIECTTARPWYEERMLQDPVLSFRNSHTNWSFPASFGSFPSEKPTTWVHPAAPKPSNPYNVLASAAKHSSRSPHQANVQSVRAAMLIGEQNPHDEMVSTPELSRSLTNRSLTPNDRSWRLLPYPEEAGGTKAVTRTRGLFDLRSALLHTSECAGIWTLKSQRLSAESRLWAAQAGALSSLSAAYTVSSHAWVATAAVASKRSMSHSLPSHPASKPPSNNVEDRRATPQCLHVHSTSAAFRTMSPIECNSRTHDHDRSETSGVRKPPEPRSSCRSVEICRDLQLVFRKKRSKGKKRKFPRCIMRPRGSKAQISGIGLSRASGRLASLYFKQKPLMMDTGRSPCFFQRLLIQACHSGDFCPAQPNRPRRLFTLTLRTLSQHLNSQM
ncbi:hypothetical protein DIPPA_63957 [Diplonema papillatum]|nr:hypothetical protein DIPPA_63957 [Diplonema papillatum]